MLIKTKLYTLLKTPKTKIKGGGSGEDNKAVVLNFYESRLMVRQNLHSDIPNNPLIDFPDWPKVTPQKQKCNYL